VARANAGSNHPLHGAHPVKGDRSSPEEDPARRCDRYWDPTQRTQDLAADRLVLRALIKREDTPRRREHDP
jgi:hypothetical protein